jgi:hypothetical protein
VRTVDLTDIATTVSASAKEPKIRTLLMSAEPRLSDDWTSFAALATTRTKGHLITTP